MHYLNPQTSVVFMQESSSKNQVLEEGSAISQATPYVEAFT